uniref:Cytochrome P450 n=1 Tax=Ganoderma boninense TaxID=34458 RepID=A0A5K1K6T7_9APHY|nr:Uncharacterized protein [Ganoderma boninense]
MVMDVPLLSAVLATSAILFFALRDLFRRNGKGHLPPGPVPLPILGNILDIPRSSVGLAFSALTKKYGDIVYFNVLGQPVIVIGSIKAAVDLLDKKSANFSGRPVSAVTKLAGLEFMFVFKQYGLQWRQHRRTFHLSFGIDRVANYRPIQLNSARRLLTRLLTSPHDMQKNINMLVADTAMKLVYGIDAAVDDPECEMAKAIEALRAFVETLLLPSGHLIMDIFPFLRHLPSWLPGMHVKRVVETGRRAVQGALDKLDNMSTAANREGRAMDSMMTRLLADAGADAHAAAMKEHNQHVAATTLLDAYDDGSFLPRRGNAPGIPEGGPGRAAVVGPDRLPEFSDYDRLPYTRAFIKELTRWHTVSPMGVPHTVVDDDEYNGYFIPAGTIVNVNIWSLSRDPEEYPDPYAFKPERFLVENPPRDPNDYIFGFGRRLVLRLTLLASGRSSDTLDPRRACPGNHFATASLFIYCTSVLHVFDIMPPKDKYGSPVALEYKAKDNLIPHIEGYEYIIKPRSAEAERLVADLML